MPDTTRGFLTFLQIIGGYRFLMNNYEENDAVLVFGFSRGAYTARCLASMISCVGHHRAMISMR